MKDLLFLLTLFVLYFFVLYILGLFVFWLIDKIYFSFLYWTNYIYARISYKKNPYKAEKNLIKLKEKLEKMEYKEFQVLVNLWCNNSKKINYDAEQHEILIIKKRGYEQGIQASMRRE